MHTYWSDQDSVFNMETTVYYEEADSYDGDAVKSVAYDCIPWLVTQA